MLINYADDTPAEYVYGAIPKDESGAVTNVRSVSAVAKAISQDEAAYNALTADQRYIVNSFNVKNLTYEAAFGTVKGNDINGYTLSPSSAIVASANELFTNGEINLKFTAEKGGYPDFRMVFDTAISGTSSFEGGFTVSIVTQDVNGVPTVRLLCQQRGGSWTGYGEKNICTYADYNAKEDASFTVRVQLSENKINVFVNGEKMLDCATVTRAANSKLYFWVPGTKTTLVENISVSELKTTASYKNAFGTTSGNDQFGYTINGSSALTTNVDALAENVEVSVKVKFNPAWHGFRVTFDTVQGDKTYTGGFYVGIVYETEDNKVYVMTQMRTSPWTAYTKTLISDYSSFDFTKEYTLRFVLNGTNITVYLDGTQIATASNVARSTASKIYIWNSSNAAIVVKEISVTHLTNEE